MKELEELISSNGKVISEKIIDVSSFLNHMIDTSLMDKVGDSFCEKFSDSGATKVLTAAVSGIPPALSVGTKLSVPVLFARKSKPVTFKDEDVYFSTATSATYGDVNNIYIKKEYIDSKDKILIIDDFISDGYTIKALCEIVRQSGACLVGIGAVIEKTFVGGRSQFEPYGAPIHSLAKIKSLGQGKISFE